MLSRSRGRAPDRPDRSIRIARHALELIQNHAEVVFAGRERRASEKT
jgi:hypothetical protein